MTIKATLAAIKALGLTARYNASLREYQIGYKLPYKQFSDTGYFTDCQNDAIMTARTMAGKL